MGATTQGYRSTLAGIRVHVSDLVPPGQAFLVGEPADLARTRLHGLSGVGSIPLWARDLYIGRADYTLLLHPELDRREVERWELQCAIPGNVGACAAYADWLEERGAMTRCEELRRAITNA